MGFMLFGQTPTYQGPGNVRSGWTMWAGLRAYSTSTVKAPVVDIYNVNTAQVQTFTSKFDGSLDTDAIATFLAGSAGKVAKLWDQTGNGFHLVQATPSNMPDYVQSVPALGGKPGMFFRKSASTVLASGSNSLSTSVGTMSAVAGRMVDETAIHEVITSGSSGTGIVFNNSRDLAQGFAGTASGSPCLDLSAHALDCVFNGASSFSCIDGTVRTYNAGANTLNGGTFKAGNNLTGYVAEVGYHSAIFSQAEALAQNADKNSFWFNSTSYEGFVATRLRRLEWSDTNYKYIQSRTGHVAAEDLTAIAIAFQSYSGASATLTQAIEYPAGVFTQVTWLGASSYTFTNVYAMISDYVSVNIPAGATFWIRSYYADSINGVFYNSWQNSYYGEATTLSTTPLSDLTMGGTITNSGAYSMPPCGIIGLTSKPSWYICGDSIAMGVGGDAEDVTSTASGRNGKVGIIAHSIGNEPFLNVGASGANQMPSDCNRLVTKASHVVNQIGVNTLRGGATAAQFTASVATFLSLLKPKQKRYQTTITISGTDPGTPSAAWTTTAQQVPHANNAERAAFNASLRNGTSGLALTGIIDVCGVLEAVQDGGKWIVSPSPPYTNDGIHPNLAGYTLVKNANLLPAATWP